MIESSCSRSSIPRERLVAEVYFFQLRCNVGGTEARVFRPTNSGARASSIIVRDLRRRVQGQRRVVGVARSSCGTESMVSSATLVLLDARVRGEETLARVPLYLQTLRHALLLDGMSAGACAGGAKRDASA